MYDGTLTTAPSGPATNHDEALDPAHNTRGNLTSTSRWLNTDNSWRTTYYTYDVFGNVLSTSEPIPGHVTTFKYDDQWANSTCAPVGKNTYAYVTEIKNALNYRVQMTYESCTGLLQKQKDENDILASRDGTTYIHDLLGRVTQKNMPDGGQITYGYNDTVLPVSVTTTTRVTTLPSILNIAETAVKDGLGRIKQTILSDPQGDVLVDTTYDGLGRKKTVSNPHRATAASTDGSTYFQYDALGRTTQVAPPDGTPPTPGSTCLPNNICTSYYGNTSTVTDQAGKKRKSQTDALGRLTAVWEDPNGLNYETDYQYDVLDNLTRVDQKGNDPTPSNWRTRTFYFDSLSLLRSATNPEWGLAPSLNGTTTYSYDLNGNLRSKTDPKSTTVSYCYDSLDRVTSKAYTLQSCPMASPDVTYTYDQGAVSANPIGRRTGMADASGSATWTFDPMGRVATEQRTISGLSKTVAYSYNFDGSLASLTYPSGRVVSHTYQRAGRTSRVRDLANGINFVTGTGAPEDVNCAEQGGSLGACYSPNGAASSFAYGSSGSFAGIKNVNSYNKRLQPITLSATASGQTLLSLTHDFHLGNGDNGNVFQITNNKDSNRTRTFSYDALNRITLAETQGNTGNCWGQRFGHMEGSTFVSGIDAWGNLHEITVTKCSATALNQAANNKNQFTGLCYDAAGNLTKQAACPGSDYTYDAENRLRTIAGWTYTYDGDGKRVKKSNGSTSTIYFTGTGSDPLAEYNLSGNLVSEYIFFNGRRIARVDNRPVTKARLGLVGDKQNPTKNFVWDDAQLTTSGSGNLLSNPGFESGQMTPWTQGAGVTQTNVHSGSYAGQSGFNQRATQTVPGILRGQSYTASIFVRSDSTGGTPEFRLNWLDDSGTVVDYAPVSASVGSSYQQLSITAVAPTNTVFYYLSDHLGSTNFVSSRTGQLEAACESDFYPFGGEVVVYGFDCPDNHYKFTGKERHAETGLDYFGARYYGSNMGRFATPDSPLLDQHIEDPQSWNLYTYGRNNPLIYVDPTGEAIELIGDEDARKKALAELAKAVGDGGSKLYINEVKDGDTTRYFVGVEGNIGDFAKMSGAASDLAGLISAKPVVEFGVTNQELPGAGKGQAAFTYTPGEIGNQNVRVLVNPALVSKAGADFSTNMLLRMKYTNGVLRDTTTGVAMWHEFGHAWRMWQNMQARQSIIPGSSAIGVGVGTNPKALEWENRMRELLYGPFGPNNAKRVNH